MSSKWNIIIILFLLIAIFVYGIAVGRYNVFPYSQVTELRDWLRGVDAGSGERGFDGITVHDTSLMRLLEKRIEVEEDYSRELFIRGGAIASLDHLIYISTNRNDENKERLVVFDTENFERMDTGGLAVPMNLAELLDSPVMDIEGFPFDRFRINGIHVEKSGEAEHVLFVSHNLYHQEERCISYSISRTSITIDGNRLQPGEWETIFTAEPCIYPEEDKEGYHPFSGQMSGGPMAEFDDDHLLISVGTYHRDGLKYESLPMNDSSPFGKIVLMNKVTGETYNYASGLRNALGLYIDSSGRIWTTDNGPQGGDELNLVREGKNFGWPEVTYGINYGNSEWPLAVEQGRHDQFDLPVYVWMPSIAATNIIEIKGEEKFRLWREDLIVGSLTNQSLHRLRIEGEDRVIYNERIRIGRRIRDLTTLNNGMIAMITDDGLLVLIEDGGPVYEEIGPVVESRIADMGRFDQLQGSADYRDRTGGQTARSIFMQNCSGCHYLNTVNDIGPHLHNVFERQVGGVDGYNYSSVLNNRDEQWTPELMKAFLLNPEQEFPNSSMQQVPLTVSEADSIVKYLQD